jgi:hypothetical protein
MPGSWLLTPFLLGICDNFLEDKLGSNKHGHHLDSGGGRLFWRLLGFRQIAGQAANGGMNLDWTTILALVGTAVLVAYLTTALLRPEIFS